MKKYFRLLEEYFLKSGENGYIIHDLINRKIFHLDETFGQILNLMELNYSLLEIEEVGYSKEDIEHVTTTLIQNKLGIYCDTKVYIEKISSSLNWQDYIHFKQPPKIVNLHIELDNHCVEDCYYCDVDKIISRFSCMRCYVSQNRGDSIPESKMLQAVNDVCNFIDINSSAYITGGQIFVNWNKTQNLLEFLIERGLKNIVLNVSKNIKEFNADGAEFLCKNGIQILMTITCYEDIEAKFAAVIRKLARFDLIKFILLSQHSSENDITLIRRQIEESFGFTPIIIQDFIYEQENKESYFKGMNFVPSVNFYELSEKKRYNSCLNGRISISSDGVIRACPTFNSEVIGSIDNIFESLKEQSLNNFWRLSKSKIKGCKECKYNYACNDCRKIEIALGADLDENVSCTFNNLTGGNAI